MLRYLLLILIIMPISVFGKFKNTDGEAIDKSIKDLMMAEKSKKANVSIYRYIR